MPPPDSFVIISTAVETQVQADQLALALVEARLAACVQVLPARSTFRWEGRVQQTAEMLLLAKTRAACTSAATALLRARHPYTLPEILVTPISNGLPEYLNWITQETTPPHGAPSALAALEPE